MLIQPTLRAFLPLLCAVFIGSIFADLRTARLAITDGTCRSFAGSSLGNDTTQRATFTLCRNGEEIHGARVSDGRAGISVFVLEGTIEADRSLYLEVAMVQRDEPAEGWISCSDDTFHLVWDIREQVLRGQYVSQECHDVGKLELLPR